MCLKIDVRSCVPNPRRCLKCHKFGHDLQSCRGRQTCAKCASNDHQSDDCNAAPHCLNCEEDHTTYLKSCPSWKKEKGIATDKGGSLPKMHVRRRYTHILIHSENKPLIRCLGRHTTHYTRIQPLPRRSLGHLRSGRLGESCPVTSKKGPAGL